jgi:hypothetical protein
MKVHDIEDLTNSNIIRLAEVLEKNEEILFQIRNKVFHVAKAGIEIYSVNVFNDEDLEDYDNLDFGFAVNAGMLYFKTSIEAIVLAKNNF